MKKYILAFDQGTTSSRSIILDDKLKMLGKEQIELPQYYPSQGWVEQDPEEIWESQITSARKLLKKLRIKADEIICLGITNQRETIIAWDRVSGKALYRAIVWQDKRTSEDCDILIKEGYSDTIRFKTGLVIDSYFSATKISWLIKNVPGIKKAAAVGRLIFGNIDAWLIYRLTGGKVHATDYSNASRTMLFNIKDKKWDEELLKLFDIPLKSLPEVKNSADDFGICQASVLGAEIPVTGVAGDQQSSLFGQACIEKGHAKNTYGTGCFLLMNTGDKFVESESGLITSLSCGINNKTDYILEGSIFIAGAAIKWLRDALKLIKKASDTDIISSSLENSEGVYVVPAFTGLGAPYWDQYARGAIFGLTHRVTNKHIIRATLESIAYQSRDIVEAMQKDSGIRITELRVDGGVSANNFLMQFQADILGVNVSRPINQETTALGAAYLAALKAGITDISKIHEIRQTETLFSPKMNSDITDELYSGWKEAVKRVRGWKMST